MKIEGAMPTPEIIFCPDPPTYDPSAEIIDGNFTLWKSEESEYIDLNVKKLGTFFKV